jgi:hypothetical protein
MENAIDINNIEIPEIVFVLVPLIAALIQMLKQIIINIPRLTVLKEFLPIVSVALGISLSYLEHLNNPIIIGVMMGLSAAGAYDLYKSKNKTSLSPQP